MIYLRESKACFLLVLVLFVLGCKKNNLPVIEPTLITEKTPHDTDDPAIWVNKENPSESIVFGTDKDELNGGVYAFDLEGKIIEEKSITGLSYPNNVDVSYGFKLNDSTTTDVIVFTEREKHQIRLYSIPDMKPLDNGGFPVFTNELEIDKKRPMGVACYSDGDSTYAIVSRKSGPTSNYLHQYQFVSDSTGIRSEFVREFGDFSGKKEIEAIAVDNELGFVFYSDEMNCIHKYYADPSKGNKELTCFGANIFERDIEGIAIVKNEDKGFLVVSNQQAHSFSVFDRNTNEFVKEINLGTVETDGCDVTTVSLGNKFPHGLFVAMNDSKEFYFYDLKNLNLSID